MNGKKGGLRSAGWSVKLMRTHRTQWFFFRNIIPSLGMRYWGSKCRNKVPARLVGPAQVIEIRARPLIPLDRNAKFFR